MKKILVRLLSVILAAVMVFPAAAFADDPLGGDVTLWCGTDKDNTYDLVKQGGVKLDNVTNWSTSGDGSISLDESTGVVTALEAGSVVLTAIRSSKNEETGDWETVIVGTWYFTIIKRSAQSIAVTTPPKKTSYISGQTFDPTGMVITATCNNGETLTVPLANCTFTPSPLTAGTQSVTITWGELTATTPVTVSENAVTKVSIYDAPSQAYVGDRLKDLAIQVQVTWADGTSAIMDTGWEPVPSGALTKDDKSFYVTFQNVKSESRNIKVVDKNSEGGGGGSGGGGGGGSTTTDDFTLEYYSGPTKKTYNVGNDLDTSGLYITVKDPKGNQVAVLSNTASTNSLVTLPYTFVDKDLSPTTGTNRTTTITISVVYQNKVYAVTVPGLTVTAPKKTLKLNVSDHEIKRFSLDLKRKSYPVGTTLSLSDVDYIYGTDYDGNSFLLSSDDLADYANTFSLEVASYRTSNNGTVTTDRKSSSYRTRIESANVYTKTNDEKIVYLRFYVDSDYYEFEYASGDSGITVYYGSTTLGVYDSLSDALEDVNDVDFKWGATSTSSGYAYADTRTLSVKLGEDASANRYDYLVPARNIEIDLNGHKLTMYTDTFRFRDKADKYTVTITNTASDTAKIIYTDMSVDDLLIDKSEKITFKYQDTDNGSIPGIYTVTVAEIKEGGAVTAKPAVSSKNTVTVAHGNDATFTVTPNKDFEIDTVKVKKGTGSETTVSTSTNKEYSLNSNTGVATYTMKDITSNYTFTAAFKAVKKEEEKKDDKKEETAWTNPFSDVNAYASYFDAVKYVNQNGLMNGMTATTFGPNQTMTRAQFVTTLGRMYLGTIYQTTAEKDAAMIAQYGTDSQFSDVSYSDASLSYAVPYIKWAESSGLVLGYGNGKFGPKDTITHQQMYIIMYRYAQMVGKVINVASVTLTASDANELGAGWMASARDGAIAAAKYAQQQHFLVSSTRIDPAGNALRYELAILLRQFSVNVLDWE